MDDVDLEIKIDKSKGNILLQKDFDNYFRKRLEEGCKGMKCNIEHSYSHSWSGLQFADLLAWCCFQKKGASCRKDSCKKRVKSLVFIFCNGSYLCY